MSYKILSNNNNQTSKYEDSEHIYYNIKIDNIYAGDASPILAVQNDKTSTILKKQSDYECAVTFWNLRGQIPVFVCPILEGNNSNINATPYGVCYSYQGQDYHQNVIYQPDISANTIIPKPPSQNNGLQDISGEYYYVYTFQAFIDMINKAFLDAYNDFNSHHGGIHSTPIWVQYDSDTGLLSYVCEYSYANDAGAQIYINSLLLNYLEAIQVDFYGFNQPAYKDFKIIIKHNNTDHNYNSYALKGGTIPAPPANPPYLKITQEYDCRYLWANIKSILFTSSTIQTRDEYIPQVYNPNLTTAGIGDNSFNPNFRSIVSYYDIIYDTQATNGANWRQYLYYNPNVYKWIDLVSDNELNNFNIEIYLQLTNGVLVPMMIPINASVDIKLLFRKKKKIIY